MIRVNILYPQSEGCYFDFDYYLNFHVPLAISLLGEHPGYHGVSVEKGLSGIVPGSEASFMAGCYFTFDSVEAFVEAFMPNAEKLQGDIPNYTNVTALIQYSEILM